MKSRQPVLVTAVILLLAALLTGPLAHAADPPSPTASLTTGASFSRVPPPKKASSPVKPGGWSGR